MYRTTLIPAAPGPARRQAWHDSLDSALAAWLADCRELRPASGDRAEVLDVDGDEHLRWVAGVDGDFASGALADAVAEDLDELTPQRIAEAVRSLLAPASATLRIAHPAHAASGAPDRGPEVRTP